jgi:hypothetical protein
LNKFLNHVAAEMALKFRQSSCFSKLITRKDRSANVVEVPTLALFQHCLPI